VSNGEQYLLATAAGKGWMRSSAVALAFFRPHTHPPRVLARSGNRDTPDSGHDGSHFGQPLDGRNAPKD